MAALLPYAVALALPFILWILFAAFRWRYLRYVRRTIYSAGESDAPQLDASHPRSGAPSLTVTWIDAAADAGQPAPPRLVGARRDTWLMRAALVAAGAVYVVAAATLVWHGQKAGGLSGNAGLALAYFSSLLGVFLIVAFAGRSWASAIAAAVAWFAGAFVLLVWPLHAKPLMAVSIIGNGLNYVSLPLLALAPLAMRTTRPLVVGFVPLVGFYIVCSAAMTLLLAAFGVSLEGAYTLRSVSGGLLAAGIGIAVAVWQIRNGVRRGFVLMLAAMLAVGFPWGAYFRFSLVGGLIGGIGSNGLLTLAVWWLFSRFLRWKARGRLPDEILHFSLCWLVLTAFLPLLSNTGWTAAPFVVLAFGAYTGVLFVLLRYQERRRAPQPAASMLLLRVFDQAPVRNRLLDVLDDSWRRVGRIDLIVGADLAVRSVSAMALEGFLFGRVHRHFLTTVEDAADRINTVPRDRAFDGRYPLNEFHCSPAVWQQVVRTLATDADLVLMDLRGWHASHRGATLELSLVMERVPLSRIVMLTERRPDEDVLARAIEHAWLQLAAESVNARLPHPSVDVIRCSGQRRIDAAAIANRVFEAVRRQPIPTEV